eukprot:11526905-Ditylum_brightwellii.AAC.1
MRLYYQERASPHMMPPACNLGPLSRTHQLQPQVLPLLAEWLTTRYGVQSWTQVAPHLVLSYQLWHQTLRISCELQD